MRLYLSGPMTGIRDFNRPAFQEATKRLRALGHSVIDPTEMDLVPSVASAPEVDHLWRMFLVRDVAMILTCTLDALVVLPGWWRSRGARLEVLAGRLVGLAVLDATTLEEVPIHFIDTTDLL